MAGYLERLEAATTISRRGFMKAGAASAALLSVAGLTGCSTVVESSGEANAEAMMSIGSDGRDVITGDWVAAACWHNCGGRCVNKALVRDGVVIRQKTDDSREDVYDALQQRSCSRGHSQRMQCFGADRLKYPMKRKNWSPEESNGHLRGLDEWERISWDDAFNYIADELNKAYDTYGPQSVLMCGAKGANRPMNARGGACSVYDTISFGAYISDAVSALGLISFDWRYSANDRYDLKNSEWIVFQGANPAWSGWGMPTYYYLQAKRAGAKFVVIGPAANASCQTLDARWIPVRTGTDVSFLLSVAYEMLQLDEQEGNIIDWDFIADYSVGFDKDHMPEGLEDRENFVDYLRGTYDGIPKTAEWATEICGTPVDDIRWYARLIAKDTAVAMLHGYGIARNNGVEDVPQMFMTLGIMGGHMGKSGHCCGSTMEYSHGNGGPILVSAGDAGLPKQDTMVDTDVIPAPFLWQSILDKKYHYCGTTNALAPGEERDLDIHVIYYEQEATIQTRPDIKKGIEANRSVDFVFTSAHFLNTQAKYSDIVLPCTTEWETVGGFATGDREYLYVYTQVVDPLYEAKTDQEIGKGIAWAMGLDADELYPISEKQQFMNKILGASVTETNGDSVPLVTVTQEDLDEWQSVGEPQEGKIGLKEFLERGFYQVERFEGDEYTYIAYEDFVKDSNANPLQSASGKFEIYCQEKADKINGIGLTTTFKPYPTYQVPKMGYETTFADFDAKIPGEYPFLIYNPHYYRRAHSALDNVTWQREAWAHPVFVNRSDAEAKGITDGDTICLYNQYGKTLRYATLLETLMPGMVALPHGAWVDLDENEEYDMAGADNILCGTVASGSAVSGYNNYNVNFEKYEGEPLVSDYEKPQYIVEL